jgi:glycine cleavage system regulatory protein
VQEVLIRDKQGIRWKITRDMMDKVKKIIEVIKSLMEKKFTGYIKVNFSRGNVGRIEKFEEILKK